MASKNDYAKFLQTRQNTKEAAGFDISRDNLNPMLFDFQKDLVKWSLKEGRTALFEDCGLGKGQPIGSMILTPNGFVRNDKLEIGQTVIASNGRGYPLLAKYERGLQKTYEVSFSDGSSFIVDQDHIHIVRTNNDRQRGKPWRNMSTHELLNSGNIRYGKDGKSRNYDIPIVEPIEFQEENHIIHPYVLGVILGDGYTHGSIMISNGDPSIIERVKRLLPEGFSVEQKSEYDYRVIKRGQGGHYLINELKRFKLHGKRSNTKFIPREYLFDSVKNRIELLRGLMDTDGYINSTSQYYSTSDQLADDTMFLIRSLGGVPTRTIKYPTFTYKNERRHGKPCHILTFSLKGINPFWLKRKAEKWNSDPRDNGRWIDSIEPYGVMKTICLSVGSPDQSYVTEHMIVTHNTPQQLEWAQKVVEKTNGNVLIIAPLAVSGQTVREGEKFGIEVAKTRDGKFERGISITNYEQLHKYDHAHYSGIVCDESSAIKQFQGKRRGEVIKFMKKSPYRLMCTATAAPNDYIELGTHSEALGVLGQMDMLNKFFRTSDQLNHILHKAGDFWNKNKWLFKAHAEPIFWRWIVSWARALRMPSDMGYDNGDFLLPELKVNQHIVKHGKLLSGELFSKVAMTLSEQREERKLTITDRCEKVAELVDTGRPAIVWCHTNDEGDLLEKTIDGAVQVAGRHSDDEKESRLIGFTNGEIRVLVTKPSIAGFGMNWQHCDHMTFFPSHSFEQYYQATRRCWRFGQKNDVTVDIVTTEGEAGVTANLQRKADQSTKMFEMLVSLMNDGQKIDNTENFTNKVEVPKWVS